MLEIRKLRKALKPCSPTDVLDHVVAMLESMALPDDFQEPLFSIHLKSGTVFKGNVLGHAINAANETKCYVVSLMIERD
ncbi:MAG: hypothetical protein AAB250_12045, partial [Bdellovibrionota bacterium]